MSPAANYIPVEAYVASMSRHKGKHPKATSADNEGKSDDWMSPIDNNDPFAFGEPVEGEKVILTIRATSQKASYVSLGMGILFHMPNATRYRVIRWCREESVGGARWFLSVWGTA